jgi:adenylate kinase
MTATSHPMQLGCFESYDETLISSIGPVLILGPPGSGKGTQSSEIALRWNIPRISTGDLLRLNVSQNTGLGRMTYGFIKSGRLVPDNLISGMVSERLESSDTLRGFILDGFPRTVLQVAWLEDFLGRQPQMFSPIVLNIHVDLDCLISRITRRRLCRDCGAIYHDEFCPPRSAGICDRDGVALEQRVDDTLEVLQARLNVYRAETEPIVERYQNSKNFLTIDGSQSIHKVRETINKAIRCIRGLQN